MKQDFNRSIFRILFLSLIAAALSMPLYSGDLFDVQTSEETKTVTIYETEGLDGVDSVDETASSTTEVKKKKSLKDKFNDLKDKGEKVADYVKDVIKDEDEFASDTANLATDSKDLKTKKVLNKIFNNVKDAIDEAKGKKDSTASGSVDGNVIAPKDRNVIAPKDRNVIAPNPNTAGSTTDRAIAPNPSVKGNTSGVINNIKSILGLNTSKTLDGFEDQKISISGNNYCGQFAMTAVLTQLGIATDAQAIYEDTNPAGIFTSPPIITEYLNNQGVKAAQKNNASIEDIIKKIDSGKPVIALVNSDGTTPHWVAIYGYKCDSDGNVISITMRDSYWGTKTGYDMPIDEFLEAWKNPMGTGIAGDLVAYSNLMIDIDGDETSTLDTAMEDNIAGGLNNVVTGFKNKDWSQMFGGAAQLVTGIPGAVTTIASRLPTTLGNAATSWGKEKIASGGIGNTILGGAAVAAGTAIEAVGEIGDFVGDVASKAASTIGKVTTKVGNFLKNLF